VCWAIGAAGFAGAAGATPHWVGEWLPWTLLIGLGTGLTVPVQSAAAVRSLPPNHFGLGSAINASSRQLGAVLGVSLFVAIQAAAPAALDGYHRSLWLFAILGLAGGAVLFVPWLNRSRDESSAG